MLRPRIRVHYGVSSVAFISADFLVICVLFRSYELRNSFGLFSVQFIAEKNFRMFLLNLLDMRNTTVNRVEFIHLLALD